MMRLVLLALATAGAFLSTQVFAEGVDAPRDVMGVFHKAVADGSSAAFLATCSPAIAKHEGIGTCGYLYDLTTKDGITISHVTDEVKGNRATVDLEATLAGKEVERFYLLLNREGGKWRITSYRTNPDKKADHLIGK